MTEVLLKAQDWWNNRALPHGSGLSGAIFGAGCWIFFDSIATSPTQVPATHYLPGVTASIALLMITGVKRSDVQDLDPFDDAYCRLRSWLLTAYIISFGAILGSVAVMFQAAGAWGGLAVIFQVACILGAALIFFLSRSSSESAGYSGF